MFGAYEEVNVPRFFMRLLAVVHVFQYVKLIYIDLHTFLIFITALVYLYLDLCI